MKFRGVLAVVLLYCSVACLLNSLVANSIGKRGRMQTGERDLVKKNTEEFSRNFQGMGNAFLFFPFCLSPHLDLS